MSVAASKARPSVKIKERKRDGVAILEMSGRLMGGPDADVFDEISLANCSQ